MSIDIPGHTTPAAGFEVPLAMLSACHDRIQRQCATLRRLVPHLARHGADGPARSAAAGVLRYFETAAVHHHADEEVDLFPALLESMAGSDAVCLRQLVAALTAEHRELELRWRRIRVVLERVVAGQPASLDADAVQALVELYQRHIEREDGELLPLAARLLDDALQDRVGHAMRRRRGVDGAV